ncbi:MAG: hypothetical protein AB8B91_20515 [Rubripirellula sp.]
MGLSIQYRSTDAMHPALAYEIKQHADRLSEGYSWLSCEPVTLTQLSGGFLGGASKPNFFPVEVDIDCSSKDGVPDGTVLTLAEVLCTLSREHGVDWEIGHDFESEPIGRISHGKVGEELVEQLEALGSVGDLLENIFDDEEDDGAESIELSGEDLHAEKLAQWTSAEFGGDDPISDVTEIDDDDEEPWVVKFPASPKE